MECNPIASGGMLPERLRVKAPGKMPISHSMRLVWRLIGVVASAQTRDSIEKQLKSGEQQRETIRKTMPVLPALAAPSCDPLPDEKVMPLIESAAKARQLPVKLLRAVTERESGFRPCAVSAKRRRA
jgi:soluble lytic murein transglycosylase-like protein